jgi:hypothetical protein
MSTSTPQPQAGGSGAEPNITMWGAPGSGKTAFIAALNLALIHAENGWNLVGADPRSTRSLNDLTGTFGNRREFPDATDAMTYFNWNMQRQAEGPAPVARRRFSRPQEIPTQEPRVERINLKLLDLPGGDYDLADDPATQNLLIENLAGSKGILFLYDPVNEYKAGHAYQHFYSVLNMLASRMIAGNEFRLPHRIAVCATKFDDAKVLQTARARNLLSIDSADPARRPKVSPEQARELFATLCSVARNPSVNLIRPTIEQFFHQDRIRFFATSSIGVYVDPARGKFDFDDSQNILVDRHGDFNIRGMIQPMNIIEPVLWLGRELAEDSRR